MKKTFDLQLFAQGENQGQPINSYIPQLHEILASVFAVKSYWSDFFTPLQLLDGITNKDIAFSIKTNDVAAAVTDGSLEAGGTPAYNTGANVAFGSGTGSTNRFGNRTEVKYDDVDVLYTWDWVYHEGIDKHTVNEDFDAAHAKELEKIANAITGKFNKNQGDYLTENAGKTITGISVANAEAITPEQAIAIFNKIDAYMTDQEVDETLTRVASVTPALYNAIVDNNLSTTAKGSDVNIDRNEVRMFKDFVIRKLPTKAFAAAEAEEATYKKTADVAIVSGKDYFTRSGSGTTESPYVYTKVASPDVTDIATYYEVDDPAVPATQDICIAGVERMGVPFTGIETARAIEAPDFDGTALQGAGKAGQFISKDNCKALVKVTVTVTGA